MNVMGCFDRKPYSILPLVVCRRLSSEWLGRIERTIIICYFIINKAVAVPGSTVVLLFHDDVMTDD
jgi:hypothetical protein